jgi:hypothetical protein
VEKGTSKGTDAPATKEVGGEVNREEWICVLCEEIAAGDMACCQHREK